MPGRRVAGRVQEPKVQTDRPSRVRCGWACHPSWKPGHVIGLTNRESSIDPPIPALQRRNHIHRSLSLPFPQVFEKFGAIIYSDASLRDR